MPGISLQRAALGLGKYPGEADGGYVDSNAVVEDGASTEGAQKDCLLCGNPRRIE
jgi:hypothetical protein